MAGALICPECGVRAEQAGHCERDGARFAAIDDPLVGQPVGRWTVTGLIGAGGAGRVYRAVQAEIGGRVAVKVLSAGAAEDRSLVERFFAEARAVNLIRHEGIVQVLDLDFLPDGRPYIVMEHLEGAPLSRLIARHGGLPLGGLAGWAREVLAALAAAHGRGIVHRDLKPANLWVTPAGRARVLDFGLAKLAPSLDARAATTRSGVLMGTPHYMSPEQADARPADERADLYAMGVVLYEGVTGVRPFEAPSLYELLRQHVEDDPPPMRAKRPNLPPALEKVIRRALEKDPAKRHGSAAELAEALAAATANLPQTSLVPPAPGDPGVDAQASTIISPAPARRSQSAVRPPSPIRTVAVIAGLLAIAGIAVVLVKGTHRSTAVPDAGVIALASIPDAAAAAAADPDAAAAAVAVAAADPDAAPPPPPPRLPKPAAAIKRPPPPVVASADAGPSGSGHTPTVINDPPRPVTEMRTAAPPDPAHFDLVAFMPTARESARKFFPDAELVMMYGSMILSNGTIDMTTKGSAGYLFRTRTLEGQDARCYVMVDVYAKGGEARATLPADPGDMCQWAIAPAPRCHPADLWKLAIDKGMPTDGHAYMRYIVRNGAGRWEFSRMGGSVDVEFKAADDCR